MIYDPLQTLTSAGIKDIMIVSGRGHAGHFLELLGSGSEFGVHFTFEIQEEAGGIAQALSFAKDFVYGDNVTVVLGDNIFQDDIKEDILGFTSGAKIFLKEVIDANRFGVAELKGDTVIGIEEKPENPKSNFAVTGLYIYDFKIFDVIKTLQPSRRSELEITDVNNYYINEDIMGYRILNGFWSDAGTFESLFRANELVRDFSQKIKVALAPPAASNGVCSRPRSGCNGY